MHQERVNTIEILQLISSKSLQIDFYEENEAPDDIPQRLFRMWKMVYLPSKKKFNSGFSESEMRQLSSFSEFYHERLSDFPPGITELIKSPYWDSVCEYASQLLEEFEKDGEI